MLKTKIVKIYPSPEQQKILDDFIDTYRYVYNKALEYVKIHGYEPNFYDLRDFLSTERTKNHYTCYKIYHNALDIIKEKYKVLENDTDEIKKSKKNEYDIYEKELIKDSLNIILKKLPFRKNDMIRDFELNTSNEIRSNAIKSVCNAYTTCFANLKNGNIKYFDISFKKKHIRQTIELSNTDVTYTKNSFQICPSKFSKDQQKFRISKRNIKKLKEFKVTHNTDLVRTEHGYFLHILIDVEQDKKTNIKKVCGIDPGVRSLLTIYSNNDLCDFNNDSLLHRIKRHNTKIYIMKKNTRKKKYRKKQLYKHEKRKDSLINETHWKTINYLVKEYDVLFLGDIKSHSITKGGKNHTLNRNMNDLKFYKFKERLHYKCVKNNKKMFLINEAYTTQGCSSCGNLWKDIGSSKIYKCQVETCNLICGRDYNAAKNMYMKGILSC